MNAIGRSLLGMVRACQPTVWLRNAVSDKDSLSGSQLHAAVEDARRRFSAFGPALALLFHEESWDGNIRSELLDWPDSGPGRILIKGDHDLPVTGSIKARGGVHEVLAFVEKIARREGLLDAEGGYVNLASAEARAVFSRYKLSVASTGNLGYSVGLMGRAFGLNVTVHMSRDAKAWKKDRLRKIGATVIEHEGDYGEACAAARAAPEDRFSHFVDDEHSEALFCGYAVAAKELAAQLTLRGVIPTETAPIVVYLPCGVGGAPGGITYGLKSIFGKKVICVFVEPTSAPAMMLALATEAAPENVPSIYDFDLDNLTVADGLAVGRASSLVVSVVGDAIDGAVTVTDHIMLRTSAEAWALAGIKLEPSAAAALAAIVPFVEAVQGKAGWPDLSRATHIAWVTGGARLPDDEWERQLQSAGV